MLVLARARNEAIIIDGGIRVEVLRLAGDVARLRFVAPKHVPVVRGVAKPGDLGAVEAVNGGIDASGMGIVDLSLGTQQVITVGGDIHIGLVDIDKSKVLLFIDAPRDVSVRAETAGESRSKSRTAHGGDASAQGLLPFPSPAGADPDGGSSASRRRATETDRDDSAAQTIPFPPPRDPLIRE